MFFGQPKLHADLCVGQPKAKPFTGKRRIWLLALGANTIFAVTLYVALSPMVARPLYERKLFRHCMQQTNPYSSISLNGVSAEDCWVPLKNGGRLHGLLFAKPGTPTITLIHHGADGNLLSVIKFADFMLTANSSAFIYDYEGYGRSTGHPDLNNLCPDGNAAFEYLTAERHFSESRIINLGISLGTGIACDVAREHRCAGVILMSPYSSFLTLAKERVPLLNAYPNCVFPCQDIENVSFVEKPHPPLLIFHGCRDRTIPVKHSDHLAAVAVQPTKYVRYEDAGHVGFFGKHLAQTLSSVREFLASLPLDQ